MVLIGRNSDVTSFLVLRQFADPVPFENNKPKNKHSQQNRKWGEYYYPPVIGIDQITSEKSSDPGEDYEKRSAHGRDSSQSITFLAG